MLMPGPIGREDKVTLFHGELLAVDGRIRTPSPNDKPDRRHIMTMCPRHLARIHDRECKLKCMGGRFDWKVRTNEADRPPFGLFDTDGLAGLQQTLMKRLPL